MAEKDYSKPKKGETKKQAEERRKNFYTAQRKTAEKSGDTATLRKLASKDPKIAQKYGWPAGGGVYRWRSIGSMSGSGVLGNPEAASAEKGRLLLKAISETIAAKLTSREFWALPWRSDPLE